MPARTNARGALTPKRKVLGQRLKETTATIYNYIERIPLGSRSEREILLLDQASSVVESFTDTERAILLRVAPRTRSRAGPMAPSEKVLRDFERMRNEFVRGKSLPNCSHRNL